eukprot:9207491-Pyramimonas_sp.AAC.1
MLEALTWHPCSNAVFFLDLNGSDLALLPKGDYLTGELTTDRLPVDTCPRLLKYADIKATADAANFLIKTAVAERTYYSQQGIVVGRNFTKHVVNFGTELRQAGVQPEADKHKLVLNSFDFAAAPPPLGRGWLL